MTVYYALAQVGIAYAMVDLYGALGIYMKKYLNKIILLLLLIPLVACQSIGGSSDSAADKKVLYVTHEPGKYHKYTPQLVEFRKIAEEAGWTLSVITGSYDEVIAKLKEKDFGKGYSAIVYNFCFARSEDLDACSNIIKQTQENGVPAMLIHCSMHSFWGTFKYGETGVIGGGYKGDARAKPDVVAKWNKNHPGEAFPVWGDFTGIASKQHGPKEPIKCVKLREHPAVKRMGDEFMTQKTELYNNFYMLDTVIPIVRGEQNQGKGKKAKAVILWEAPQGKSKVIGFTIGHDIADWSIETFRYIIMDSVDYLIANP